MYLWYLIFTSAYAAETKPVNIREQRKRSCTICARGYRTFFNLNSVEHEKKVLRSWGVSLKLSHMTWSRFSRIKSKIVSLMFTKEKRNESLEIKTHSNIWCAKQDNLTFSVIKLVISWRERSKLPKGNIETPRKIDEKINWILLRCVCRNNNNNNNGDNKH